MCDCKECQILMELDLVSSSLFYVDFLGGEGPITYYKYKDDEEEVAYQRGMKAGLTFLYNETVGYKLL